MSPTQNTNPSMLDLQGAISDVELLIMAYQQTHASYVTDLEAGLHTKSSESLSKLKTLNDKIKEKITYIQTTSADIKNKNSLYKNSITTTDAELDAILDDIKNKNTVLKNLQKQQAFQHKEIETTRLLADSNYYHLVAFFIIYSVIAYFLIKTFATESSGSAETIILILGISIFIYYFIEHTF